jgi:hypothetical protein
MGLFIFNKSTCLTEMPLKSQIRAIKTRNSFFFPPPFSHSRTVHRDIIKVFYLPTDAQVNCFKKNIIILLF